MEIIRKINDELTIAGQVTLEQLQQVAQEGFKSVLNLRSPDEEGFLSNEQQQVEELGLYYLNIPVKVATRQGVTLKQAFKQAEELGLFRILT